MIALSFIFGIPIIISHSNYTYAPNSPQPQNVNEYGKDYYTGKIAQMAHGYKHPYHTEANPIFFSHYNYMKTLLEAVGPE